MTTTPPEPVQSSIDATNSGDLAGFLATFTADGVVDDWGRTFAGPDQITEWSNGECIGKNMILDIVSTTVRKDQVIVGVMVGGGGYSGPSTFTYTLRGDQVASLTIRE